MINKIYKIGPQDGTLPFPHLMQWPNGGILKQAKRVSFSGYESHAWAYLYLWKTSTYSSEKTTKVMKQRKWSDINVTSYKLFIFNCQTRSEVLKGTKTTSNLNGLELLHNFTILSYLATGIRAPFEVTHIELVHLRDQNALQNILNY